MTKNKSDMNTSSPYKDLLNMLANKLPLFGLNPLTYKSAHIRHELGQLLSARRREFYILIL